MICRIPGKGRCYMIRKLLIINIALLMFVLLFPLTTLAAETASYSLIISNDKPEIGKEVQVTVKGKNLQDVYAYEVNFVYDDSQLRFKAAKSAFSGFTVPAILKKDHLQFASTKIGNAPGENGEVTLCTLTFEAIGGGKASIELTDVKLVNSKLASVTHSAGTVATTEIKNMTTFTDISGHWAKEAIEKAAKLGFVNGYEDGSFRPQGLVTRSEFAVILARALHLPVNDKQLTFSDLDSIPQWASTSISATVKAGIVTGYEDNTFRSDQRITRAEITTMIVRALGLSLDTTRNSTFADADDIPAWAKTYITAASEAKLVQGRDGNLFAPNDQATRAEAVTLILSMLNNKK